jgi:integrase/recombinase XerD
MNRKPLVRAAIPGSRGARQLRITSDFLASLREQGYAPGTMMRYQRIVEHCSGWLASRGLSFADLGETVVASFLQDHLPACCCSGRWGKNTQPARGVLNVLLSFLRQQELVKVRPLASFSAKDRLVYQYDQYLDEVCGLTERTRRGYLIYAHQFLEADVGQRLMARRKLLPGDINQFVERRAAQWKTGTVRALVTTLRNLLRFLSIAGLCSEHLPGAVACPAPAPRNPLPQTLSEVQVRKFLRSFNRREPLGRRDFAMALCLCRLGLRVSEVASLKLEDLNWENQTLHLRDCKSRRGRVLPLPPEVASAIAQYLREGHPRLGNTRLFARHRVPGRTQQGVHLVMSAMRRGFRRAGLGCLGVHRLRHTVATRLHGRGTHIKVIADLLGHKVLDTTARYARVNFKELRQACLPWPKG